jgi:hypothetical protein
MWANGFHVPAVNQAFLARGETLWLSPDLIVHQHRSRNIWEGLQEPFGRGFGFASMRVVRSSAGQRLFYTIFSPFLPALHLKRLISNVIRKKTRSGPVIRALPFIFLLSILWSWGEFIGYLRGPKEGIG